MKACMIRCVGFSLAVLAANCPTPVLADAGRFNEAEIRTALGNLAKDLQAPGPAWVYDYTEDAVFVGSTGPAVQGRTALFELAQKTKPLEDFALTPVRIEGNGNLAYAYIRASWTSAQADGTAKTLHIRSLLVFRKDGDGMWRVTQELLHPDPEFK